MHTIILLAFGGFLRSAPIAREGPRPTLRTYYLRTLPKLDADYAASVVASTEVVARTSSFNYQGRRETLPDGTTAYLYELD